jgi:GxxExxY protein
MNDIDLNKLTEKIIGCAFDISNSLGIGFVEKVYENAYAHLLRKTGHRVILQHPIKVLFDGIVFGEFFGDLLVDDLVLIELKAVTELANEHTAQALNYLRATGLPVCLLINFGKPRIQVRHLHPSPNWKASKI